METIQVVMEKALLEATDRAAQRLKVNRSALVRRALRQHLRHLEAEERERRDREGYRRRPDTADDLHVWDEAAAWPEE